MGNIGKFLIPQNTVIKPIKYLQSELKDDWKNWSKYRYFEGFLNQENNYTNKYAKAYNFTFPRASSRVEWDFEFYDIPQDYMIKYYFYGEYIYLNRKGKPAIIEYRCNGLHRTAQNVTTFHCSWTDGLGSATPGGKDRVDNIVLGIYLYPPDKI